MIEKFNGIVYLIIFVVHFLVYAVYAFRAIVGTKGFMDQYNIDHSAAEPVLKVLSMYSLKSSTVPSKPSSPNSANASCQASG